jgi:serine/threonine protein kinase
MNVATSLGSYRLESDWHSGHWITWSGTTYSILGTLARGGMAEIFLAVPSSGTDNRTSTSFSKEGILGGPPCVIKTLRSRSSNDSNEKEVQLMFAHEAQVALRLDHPNIGSHFGAGTCEKDGRPFLVMEYLEGQTLASLVASLAEQGNALSTELCVYIVVRILRALAYVHDLIDEAGEPLEIVHRDVCPRNVIVGYDGFVKLIDFGIAQSRLTRTCLEGGVINGKPNYMSPEQATGRRTDRRSDVFSMGVVLWELLTRQRFAGKSAPKERRYRLPFARVPRVREVRSDVSPALDAIVARALHLDPNARYETASEMTAALVDYLDHIPNADGRPELSFLLQSTFAASRRERRARIAELVASCPSILENSGERPIVRAPDGRGSQFRRDKLPSSIDIDIDINVCG